MPDITINTDKLNAEDRELLAKLEEKAKRMKDPMVFEEEQEYHIVSACGLTSQSTWEYDSYDKRRMAFGNVFHTIEQAELAAEVQKPFHRELQFAILHGGYREFVQHIPNYYLIFDPDNDSYAVEAEFDCKSNRVYMTKECVELLCKKLNVGEYEL